MISLENFNYTIESLINSMNVTRELIINKRDNKKSIKKWFECRKEIDEFNDNVDKLIDILYAQDYMTFDLLWGCGLIINSINKRKGSMENQSNYKRIELCEINNDYIILVFYISKLSYIRINLINNSHSHNIKMTHIIFTNNMDLSSTSEIRKEFKDVIKYSNDKKYITDVNNHIRSIIIDFIINNYKISYRKGK